MWIGAKEKPLCPSVNSVKNDQIRCDVGEERAIEGSRVTSFERFVSYHKPYYSRSTIVELGESIHSRTKALSPPQRRR